MPAACYEGCSPSFSGYAPLAYRRCGRSIVSTGGRQRGIVGVLSTSWRDRHSPYLRAARGVAWRVGGESPGLEDTVMRVALDREEDASAADMVILLGRGAGAPAVARDFAVGGGEELVPLVVVLADEEHERRLIGVD